MKLDIFKATDLISKQQAIANGLFRDSKSTKTSKYWILYEAIKNQKVIDDASAMKLLKYTEVRSYNRFRERFTHKVLNCLLLDDVRILDQDNNRDNYHRLLKIYSAARIFHYFNQKKNAVVLYKYVHSKARKEEILDLEIFVLQELKKHYAYVEPNVKKYQSYQKLLTKALKNLNRTIEINGYYDDLSHRNIINTPSKQEKFRSETIDVAENLMNSIQEEELFENQNKIFEIASFAYNINGRHKDAIDVSLTSIDLTLEKRGKMTYQVLSAYRDILTSYLKIREYDKAKEYLDKIMSSARTHGHNYFRYKSIEYSLYAVTKDYNSLYKITQEMIGNKSLKNFSVQLEEWQIRQAFANIFVEAGRVIKDVEEMGKWKFKLTKFINQVEFYSKDKRGTNISVLVIQLIHYLIYKEYHLVVDRLDALNQYTYRYLRNDETLRSNCFIKMLLKLPEAEYHPTRTKRYVAKYKKKLDENPFELSMKEIGVEIIPYEDLWEIILEILGTNLSKK